MRLGATKSSAISSYNGLGNQLWDLGGIRPSLDLDFAGNKNLFDSISTKNLITFTRASNATYVDSDGLIKTAATNEARFDHNPTTGESLGLSIEEQRTNLLTYSEDVSQWLSPLNATLVTNNITAPDEATTADRLLETAVTGLHACDSTAATFVTSTTYTYSVFVKSIGGRNFEIGFPSVVFAARFAKFTLSGSGSIQSTDAGVTASILSFPNGWYRCVATSTCTQGAASRISNFINNSSNARNYAGNTSAGIYLWGAQLEAAAFSTSYIPTTAATVTRSADVASITGANFSSWFNQTSGTVFGEYRTPASGIRGVTGFNDNTANEQIALFTNGTNPKLTVVDGGVTQADLTGGTIVSNVMTKSAGAYAVNNFAFVHAGGAAVTDSAGTLPTIDRLLIGVDQGGNYQNGRLKRLTYWPQRLADTTLQRITQ